MIGAGSCVDCKISAFPDVKLEVVICFFGPGDSFTSCLQAWNRIMSSVRKIQVHPSLGSAKSSATMFPRNWCHLGNKPQVFHSHEDANFQWQMVSWKTCSNRIHTTTWVQQTTILMRTARCYNETPSCLCFWVVQHNRSPFYFVHLWRRHNCRAITPGKSFWGENPVFFSCSFTENFQRI